MALTAARKQAGTSARHRGIGRALLFGISAVWHLRSLHRLWSAPEGGLLDTFVRSRPELWSLLRVRFLTAAWNAQERFDRIIDHCATVERIGAPFDLLPNQNAMLADLIEIGPHYRLVLDSPRWLLLDGLLALSLFDGHERLYSIAFILSRDGDGLTAYVGGVQGRRGADTLDRYRAFTRAACGVRPPDLMVELLRQVCGILGVRRLRCVANDWRHQRGPGSRLRGGPRDTVTFDYDGLWRERGGVPATDGFYDLAIERTMRPIEEVPAKRRAERRRRHAMLGSIRTRLAAALSTKGRIIVDEYEPIGWP